MWFSAEEIRERFNFSLRDSTDDAPIEFASENAEQDLYDWLSEDDYALGTSDAEPDEADDLMRYKRIKNAHAFLTVSYVFLTNTQIRSGGAVKNERDGDATISFYTPAELAEMRAQYAAQAKNLIDGLNVITDGASSFDRIGTLSIGSGGWR